MESYKCPICGNTDIHSIGYLNGKPYCRRCISFRGKEADEPVIEPKNADYQLNYRLSKEQKALSKQLVKNYKSGKNSLVHAVCGSGKTEIILYLIKYTISKGLKVGFVCPRRDVVIELFYRFKNIFINNKFTLLYGGHTNVLEGDLICMTAHQLFRYEKYFDLLIMDEIDAFPYKGNDLLHTFFFRALKGNYVLLSATPDKQFLDDFKKNGGEVLELFIRFHKHPLPVPKIKTGNIIKIFLELITLLRKYYKENKPVFVFTPTIDICETLFNLLRLFIRNGNYVHSKHPYRSKVIDDFRNGKFKYLVTTAVLERGVTIKNLQVIIFQADHQIYDRYSLEQISGRVGRKSDAPKGDVYYLAKRKNVEMEESIKSIERANKVLQNLL